MVDSVRYWGAARPWTWRAVQTFGLGNARRRRGAIRSGARAPLGSAATQGSSCWCSSWRQSRSTGWRWPPPARATRARSQPRPGNLATPRATSPEALARHGADGERKARPPCPGQLQRPRLSDGAGTGRCAPLRQGRQPGVVGVGGRRRQLERRVRQCRRLQRHDDQRRGRQRAEHLHRRLVLRGQLRRRAADEQRRDVQRAAAGTRSAPARPTASTARSTRWPCPAPRCTWAAASTAPAARRPTPSPAGTAATGRR